MQEVNKFKLGLFTLSALALFLLAVTVMGVFDNFQPKAKGFTIVEESVQGLTSGSAVKYKGVPIGNVTDILILTDNNRIQIDFEVDLSKFRRRLSDGESFAFIENQKQFYAYLQTRIRKGLTCRIEPDGITGSKYIEMDFFQDTKKKRLNAASCLRNGRFYVPSTPSMMSNLRMNALEILASIAAVDFKGISDQLGKLLSSANETLQKSHLDTLVTRAKSVVEKLDGTIGSFSRSVRPQDLDKLMKDLNDTVLSVKTLSNDINKTVKDAAVPVLTSDVRSLAKSLEGSNLALQQTLQKANDTLDTMTDLVRYINENPSSVLRGRGKQNDPFKQNRSQTAK